MLNETYDELSWSQIEDGISLEMLLKLTRRGQRFALWLLNNDSMPAEVNFMLESWTSSEEYDPAVCERALEYVARQFGYGTDPMENI